MAIPKVRLAGSGLTSMLWRNQRLAYLQTLQDTPPQPVAGAQVVQPIDEQTPLEIVTAQAVGAGTLRLSFYELFSAPVWAQLPGLEGTNTLLEVLLRQIQLGEITCRKLIRDPSSRNVIRARVYHGLVVTDIDEGEQVMINTMTLPKTLTAQYISTSIV